MTFTESLDELYNVLDYILKECNRAFLVKGVKRANTLSEVPERIFEIISQMHIRLDDIYQPQNFNLHMNDVQESISKETQLPIRKNINEQYNSQNINLHIEDINESFSCVSTENKETGINQQIDPFYIGLNFGNIEENILTEEGE